MEDLVLDGLELVVLHGRNHSVIVRFRELPHIEGEGISIAEAYLDLKETWTELKVKRKAEYLAAC